MTGVGGISSCLRCGTCCRGGGPALHHGDRDLVETGRLRLDELFTIRQGERVRDNVQDRIMSVAGDVIKVKSGSERQTCLFYDAAESVCRIYDHRPLECRTLKCWDTAEIKAVYDCDRLTRADLLKGRHDCWDLVDAHQQICDYGIIEKLVKKGNEWERLSYLIRYDAYVRQRVVEKTGLIAGLLDFLFGLPLSVTIERYGIKTAEIRGCVVEPDVERQ